MIDSERPSGNYGEKENKKKIYTKNSDNVNICYSQRDVTMSNT